MNMLKSKKGNIGTGIEKILMGSIMAIILVVVLIGVITVALPILVQYFGYLSVNMTAAGIPFATFFQSGGLVYLVIGAVVVIAIIAGLFVWLSSLMHKKR